MISGNLAFVIGWERKMRIRVNNGKVAVIEIEEKWLKILIGVFSICSFLFTAILKLKSQVLDGVIAYQFQGLGFLGLILSIIYLKKYAPTKFVILSLIVCTIPIIEYAFSIYGSRQSLFTLVLLYIYLAVYKWPKKYKILKRSFLIFLIFGFIASLSIIEIRNSIKSDDGYLSGVGNIDFVNNLKKSFTNSYNPKAGMDLGNAALAINRCKEIGQYNYGFFIWDGFVFNYIPKRLVGETIKNSLMVNDDYMRKYIRIITNNITCTTGYYDSFSAFSYFGFIIYFFLGRLFKYVYLRADFSIFFEMLFLFTLINTSVSVTHGLQLVLSKFEFVVLLFIFLGFTLKNRVLKFNLSKTEDL
jgi:hypothetical protein